MRTPLTTALLLVGPALSAACSCGEPSLPPPPTTPPQETADTATEMTGDTAPPLPCEVPEVEPNDTVLEPTLLPTDYVGCGGFAFDGDFDNWSVEVLDSSWLSVSVIADEGSVANVAIILSGDESGIAAARDDDEEDPDVHMVFPAQPDTYSINVREEAAKSGERYTYEILASVAKEPLFIDADGLVIDWVDEVEPNDDIPLATPLRNGDAHLGATQQPFDIDWYRVAVPAGKHTLTFEIQAYAKGSAGNFQFVLFSEALEVLERKTGGQPPSRRDPFLRYDSDGDEVLYLQVSEEDNLGNPATWYLLDTRVETSP